jgi:hypothetical protein
LKIQTHRFSVAGATMFFIMCGGAIKGTPSSLPSRYIRHN